MVFDRRKSGNERGFPFACVVKDERGNLVSVTRLEVAGIPSYVVGLLVHGSYEEAVKAMAEWESEYSVSENK